jgi:hypothetical protein
MRRTLTTVTICVRTMWLGANSIKHERKAAIPVK